MTVLDPMSCAPADLANPAITQMDLARIAQFRPDLHPLVREHPACYPELATWIEQRAALLESEAAEQPSTEGAVSDDDAAADSTRACDASATASEPSSPSATGTASPATASAAPIRDAIWVAASPARASDFEPIERPTPGRPAALASPASADDTATPVGNIASPAVASAHSARSARSAPRIIPPASAPEIITAVPGLAVPAAYEPTAATATPGAPSSDEASSCPSADPARGSAPQTSPEPLIPASAVPSAIDQPASGRLLPGDEDGTASLWRRLLLWAVPVLAVLCLVSTFLPIVTITFDTGTWSFNYWNGDGVQEALMLLVVFIVATGIGLAAIITPRRSRLILTGIAGTVSALLATSDGLRNIIRFSGDVPDMKGATGASVGSGAILLAVGGVVLLLISVLHLACAMRGEPGAWAGQGDQASSAHSGHEA
ncbi:hypothetical protein [Actinomyces marmotae]|uniref:variant leucine-rich repeat-containing protein n=1 Tax=Actinomyces marmotae TaxID=2737173 RepID=UPI00135B926A|nr:hypothetical protein [Actinomyces marmotae]